MSNELYNGASFDYEQGNLDVAVLASAARTATGNGPDMVNKDASGVVLTLDITAVSGTTPTLDVKVQSKDSLTGKYVDIPGAAFSQKNGVLTDQLVVYPGVAVSANKAVSNVLPRNWRIVYTIGGTTPSFTFAVSAAYVK